MVKGIESDHFRSAAYELISGLMLHALYKQELIIACAVPWDMYANRRW